MILKKQHFKESNGKLHFFLEISKLFQKIIPFFEKVFQKTRFFEKMLLEILQFLFFLSEVDAESCFTLRKSDFKREPLHFHLPNDAKFQFFQKVFKKVFQKVFQKSLCFEKFYDFREVFQKIICVAMSNYALIWENYITY